MAEGPKKPNNTAKNQARQRVRDFTEALEILSHVAQGQLGNVSQLAFFVGDGLQRAVTDSIFDALRPETWRPASLFKIGSALINQSAQLTQLFVSGEAQTAWQELINKVEVFALVKNLSSVLALPEKEFIPLPDLVEKAYGLSSFDALWAVEGVGHYYADDCWAREGPPQGLLAEENAPVPAKSLLMLHAGMGLCFADRLVGALTTESTAGEVREALEQFVTLCTDNSRVGYLGAAVESLGIVTRDFYPDLSKIISEQFRIAAPELAGFYWHGIGRAIYFSRKFFLPHLFSMWNDVNVEAKTEPERMSVRAGLTWAFTLVNMRHPAIVEPAVRAYARDSTLAQAFSNGVSSCIVMRSDTTPNELFVSTFYEHRPASQDRELTLAWQRHISQPAVASVCTYYPALYEHHALDQVFRYQDLAQLVECLQAQSHTAPVRPPTAAGCGCCEEI
ncbi:MAG: hypothetical protein LAO78_16660 [Acidobacteriia bacterium]|nr:hypothetical protein [Terriglobia bacterium]